MSGQVKGDTITLTQELCQAVHDLTEVVRSSQKTTDERMQEFQRAIKAVEEAQAAAPRQVSMPEFEVQLMGWDVEGDGGRQAFQRMMASRPVGSPASVALVQELQRANDDVLMTRWCMEAAAGRDLTGDELSKLRVMQRFTRLRNALAKEVRALDVATSGEGSQWVPEAMSAQVMEKMALQLRVAGLFETFTMPTNLYRWPFETALPAALRAPEIQANTNPWAQTGFTGGTWSAYASGKPTGRATFDGNRKLRILEVMSRELEEDMVVPALPWLSNRLAYGMGRGWEDACLNADTTTGTHIDNDVTVQPSGVSTRTVIDGLRKFLFTLNNTIVTISGNSPTTTEYRTCRAKMGEYGLDTPNLVWVCSAIGYIHMLNNSDVRTVDKYGTPGATLLSGELARFDGIPVVPSGLMRDDVHTTGKNTAAQSNDKTSILLVHRPNWLWGTRPGLGVEAERIRLTDQTLLVLYDRRDFQFVGASTEKCVGALVSLSTTTL